ncbi:hypothetical protein BU24DRAFT_457741 [Aaosphaeria arxii CBS 175.79]|uniref:Uncharacterized protein n=1 Tax=Aaosphaeria arxii CBS 175.79 TaxID=1450172 RepID=A0A6A5Y899_9PLEO|nr:uncharacterized protein BU24DRAFT_457741 [Aaosphaeria arxii CBS 175.79]KAF2021812.1 hypothetical protein BU24DRAFT_457741 [Aaosphaeria arxii CBS 175.79]
MAPQGSHAQTSSMPQTSREPQTSSADLPAVDKERVTYLAAVITKGTCFRTHSDICPSEQGQAQIAILFDRARRVKAGRTEDKWLYRLLSRVRQEEVEWLLGDRNPEAALLKPILGPLNLEATTDILKCLESLGVTAEKFETQHRTLLENLRCYLKTLSHEGLQRLAGETSIIRGFASKLNPNTRHAFENDDVHDSRITGATSEVNETPFMSNERDQDMIVATNSFHGASVIKEGEISIHVKYAAPVPRKKYYRSPSLLEVVGWGMTKTGTDDEA